MTGSRKKAAGTWWVSTRGLGHTRGANLPRALALPSELRDLEARGEGLEECRRFSEFIFFLFAVPLAFAGFAITFVTRRGERTLRGPDYRGMFAGPHG